MAKILVTGGCGYLGSHTIVDLLENGFSVISIDDLSRSTAYALKGIEQITGKQIKNYEVDLKNFDETLAVFQENPDIAGVIHFAAYKAVGESVIKPLVYYENNLFGLINILKCVNEFRVPDFVFSSSCTVYGNPDTLPVTESSPIKIAESPYGATKQMGEENLVPVITQTAIGKLPKVTVFGNDYPTRDGSCIRDYVHVCDIASAHTLAIQYLQAEKNSTSCEVFNLGTGNGVTVLEAIHAFEKVSGTKLNYEIGPRRDGDVVATYANNNAAVKELGWQISYDLDEMMRTAWAWECKIKKVEETVQSN
jgi:UDP-glucose 4-epimerase